MRHWEVRKGTPLSAKHTTEPYPPVWVSENYFALDNAKAPFLPVTEVESMRIHVNYTKMK